MYVTCRRRRGIPHKVHMFLLWINVRLSVRMSINASLHLDTKL